MSQPLNIPRLLAEIFATLVLAELAVIYLLPIVAPDASMVLAAVLHVVMISIMAGPLIVWRLRTEVWRSGLSQSTVHSTLPRHLITGIAAALALGLAATFAVTASINQNIQYEARTRFDQLSERLMGEAQRRVMQPRYGLAGVRGVYAANHTVQRGEFAAYVASRNLRKEFPGAIGFGFIERVMRTNLDTFISDQRADGAPDFSVKSLNEPNSPEEPAPDLYVIKHCFPKERNAAAWGLDIGSEPTRRKAAERAAMTGEPAISGRVTLVQDEKEQSGFLYFLPVYKNGSSPLHTPQDRLASLVGLTYAPIILEEALAGVADSVNDHLDFEIFQGEQPSVATKLFDLDKHLGKDNQSIDSSDYAGRMFLQSVPVTIGGETWTFITSTTPTFHATVDRTTPVLVGIGGLVLSFLLAGTVWSLGSARARAIQLAQAMTMELAAAKASAERLAEIARRTSNAVVITDSKGCTEWVNEGFTRLTGYTLEDVKGRTPGSVLQGPQTDPAVVDKLRQAISTRENVTAEIVNYSKDGRPYIVALEITPLSDAQGTLTGFMSIESDVTERVETQQRLAATTCEAQAANRAKSAFLANMSHEIRTPLTAILGYADLLREDGDFVASPQQRTQALETIKNAGKHLLTVINDILDLSKIEADKMTVESVDTHLVGVLHEVESLIRPKASGKGLSLRVDLVTPLPEHVISDPTRLRQILLNLVGNAVKFTDVGGVTICPGIHTKDGQSKIVIDIHDTGPGMSSEQAARLFQSFSQADQTTTRKFGGTGLGLTISRRLATLMGGDATLVSTQPGKGSCFRLEIPLESVPGSPMITHWEAVMALTARAPAPVSVKLTGRILLAEDGIDNQRLIAYHLRKAGATVEVADNGQIAYEMLEKAQSQGMPFDLLLTDMQMPEMDGYTLARKLRDRGFTIPIVALTAHAMAEDRKLCIQAGCDDYTTKPIDKQQLLSVCQHGIHKASQSRNTQIAA